MLAVAKDTKSQEDVVLDSIFTEPDNTAKHRHLAFITKVGFHFVLSKLNRLVLDKFLN